MAFEEKKSGIVLLLAGVWQLKGIRRNKDKANSLYVSVKGMSNTLPDYWEIRNWRMKFLNKKWLNMNNEVA